MPRHARNSIAVLVVAILAAAGCQRYSDRDATLLAEHGGHFVLSGEGPGRYMTPVGAVVFDDHDRPLTDEEFAAVFPAVQQMDPMVLLLRGRHTISDESIPLLNRLGATEHLDISGTEVSIAGVRALRLKRLRALVVSPTTITEEQAAELRRAFPKVEVTRWQAPASPRLGETSAAARP